MVRQIMVDAQGRKITPEMIEAFGKRTGQFYGDDFVGLTEEQSQIKHRERIAGMREIAKMAMESGGGICLTRQSLGRTTQKGLLLEELESVSYDCLNVSDYCDRFDSYDLGGNR